MYKIEKSQKMEDRKNNGETNVEREVIRQSSINNEEEFMRKKKRNKERKKERKSVRNRRRNGCNYFLIVF